MPTKKGHDKKWWLPCTKCREYAENAFQDYFDEETLKDVLLEAPIPDHSFLKVLELDENKVSEKC